VWYQLFDLESFMNSNSNHNSSVHLKNFKNYTNTPSRYFRPPICFHNLSCIISPSLELSENI
jgi:hypothetical protein